MSFTFEWPRFSEQFHADAMQMLDAALNKGKKPPILADAIQVVELEMGLQPPELEIRDIGELTTDQFRGIFRLTYAGDAHIVLRTKVQANPLNNKRRDIHSMTGSAGILAAHQPLVVPMLLRLSNFRLSGHVVLVVSRQKGVTLVFKTDPLQNVDVNSTFDSIAVIQKYIQKEIEGQLRNMFREDLPGIIHRLSQRWLAAQTEKKIMVKTDYAIQRPIPIPVTRDTLDALDRLQWSAPPSEVSSVLPVHASLLDSPKTQPSLTRSPSSTDRGSFSHAPASPTEDSAFPDLENFDPTYGLRSDRIPTTKSHENYTSLLRRASRLRDTMQTHPELGEMERSLPDSTSWDDGVSSQASTATGEYPELETLSVIYETYPAVGGGVIRRPKIYHAQSTADHTSNFTGDTLPRRPTSLIGSRQTSFLGTPDLQHFPRLHASRPTRPTTRAFSDLSFRHSTTSALRGHQNSAEPSCIPSTSATNAAPRSPHLADSFDDPMTSLDPDDLDDKDAITIRPSLNSNISYLSSLSRSYHTLSPYTQSVEHFMVRSAIPQEPHAPQIEKSPIKARRRRVYRIGGSKSSVMEMARQESASPSPPSDCELSDVEHYFRFPSR